MSLIGILKRTNYNGGAISANPKQANYGQRVSSRTFESAALKTKDLTALGIPTTAGTGNNNYTSKLFVDKSQKINAATNSASNLQSSTANSPTYLDAVFNVNRLGPNQYEKLPVTSVALAAIDTAVPNTNTAASTTSAPSPDQRYTATIGFGFVLYGTTINGGYALPIGH